MSEMEKRVTLWFVVHLSLFPSLLSFLTFHHFWCPHYSRLCCQHNRPHSVMENSAEVWDKLKLQHAGQKKHYLYEISGNASTLQSNLYKLYKLYIVRLLFYSSSLCAKRARHWGHMDSDSVSMAMLSHFTVKVHEISDDPLLSISIVTPLGSIYSRD
jgi:hypothetical protein